MQLGRAWLMQEEQQRRQMVGRCFYCGEIGHLVAVCPAKMVNQVTASEPVSHTLTTVKVTHHTTTELEALRLTG